MIGLLLLATAAMGQDYSFPSSSADRGFFYPTAYYDHAGNDWNCGTNTYSGHRGNDFGAGGFTGMDAGRDIVAAAPGTVSYVHDGEFDRCTSGACSGGGGFGNYVRVDHADGKATYYAHLKNGSITVGTGQAVSCGQKIGEMGSSGASTGPHVHFEVRNTGGAAADPFDGPCSAPPSWWASQGSYNGLPGDTCTPQSCSASDTLTCGETVSRANSGSGSTSGTTVYSCSTWSYPAPEVAWTFTPTVSEPVSLSLTGLSADLDLFVLGGGGCDAGNCTSSSQNGNADPESLTFNATAGSTYTVVVDGYVGATSNFTLSASCTAPSCHAPFTSGDADYCVACDCDAGEGDCDTDDECAGALVCLHDRGDAFGYSDSSTDVCVEPCVLDAQEPDDSPTEATVGPGSWTGLEACLGNEDWFAVDLVARDVLTAVAAFAHADGDVDVRIFDPAGVEVAAGVSTDDDEVVDHIAAMDGTYTVQVTLYAEGTDTVAGAPYELDLFVERPSVLLEISGVVPGQPTDFTLTNAPANAEVAILVSPGQPGPGPCHPGFGTCLDLTRPTMLTTLTVDAQGQRQWTVTAPTRIPPGPYSFQAVVVVGDPHSLSPPVTIDVLGPPLIIADALVTEGDSGATIIRFPVALPARSRQPITVDWSTADGTATAPEDYSATSGTLVFAPGETVKYAELLVQGDALDEADETFTVTLSNPQGASLAVSQTIGTIVDDDPEPVLQPGEGQVVEGDTGTTTLTIPVTLAAPSGRQVTVDWVAEDAEATIPDDVEAAAGTLTFAPGETAASVELTVLGDLEVEPDERIAVLLSNPVNAQLSAGSERGYGWILDDGDTGATVPDAPTGVSAQSGLDRQVRVSWTAPAVTGGPAIDGYEVQQGSTIRAAAASPYDWTGLSNGSSYSFTVRACNVVGCGPWSAPSNSATPYTTPSAPGRPSVTSQNNAIAVSWSAPGNGGSSITRYDLNYGSTTVNTGTSRSRTVQFGQSGSERTFRVRACNAAGCGGYSSYSTAIRPRTIQVSRGGAAPAGYWYDTTVTGPPGLSLTLQCNDGVDIAFWSQSITVGSGGTYRDSTLCYSGDANPHWVHAGSLESNRVNF